MGKNMPEYMEESVLKLGPAAFDSILVLEDGERYVSEYGYTWEKFLQENPNYHG